MKKKGLFITLMCFCAMFAMAHPPKNVVLTYIDGKLKIVAVHQVKDPTTHYIDELKISVDGKEVKDLKYKSQTSATDQTVEEALPGLKAGSVITVKASCNRFGSKKGTLEVK